MLYTVQPSLLRTSVMMLLEQGVLIVREFMDELSQDYNLSMESSEVERLLDLPKDILKVVNETSVYNLNIKNRVIDIDNVD
ncbi:hypothetical protein GCM10008905_20260 [Clostridium malenominatum]|uniref:Uncharacterized protein n=1 Tax=Clostridium malenominatum TaxID=1539 RepID=A0ABN1J0K5_9CLOT